MTLRAAAALLAVIPSVAAQALIDPLLSREVALGRDSIPVLILLKNQPQSEIVGRHEGGSEMRRLLIAGRMRDAQLRSDQASADALRVDLDAEAVRTRQAAFREIRESIDGEQSLLASKIQRLNGRAIQRLTGVNLISAIVSPVSLPELAADPLVAEIAFARDARTQLSTSVASTGAPALWALGFTGRGESAAVIDTGVLPTHPAFRGVNLIPMVSLTTARSNPCFGDDANSAVDQQLHGTHVNGIVAGQGITGFANNFGMARGIGELISIKAGFRTKPVAGRCEADQGSFAAADWLSGIDYLAANTAVKVVNMSFGGDTESDDDLTVRLVDYYADTFGITFTIAAGNEGPGAFTVGSPAISYNAITVANMNTRGTVDKRDDTIATSSSRGPTVGQRNKPDLAAPGSNIVAANLKSDGLVALTGTSMAAPHVAGAAVLLRDSGIKDPLSLKALMINSTDVQAGWLATTGWGFLNLTSANAQRDFVIRNSMAAGSKRYYRGSAGSLRATLVWNRRFTANPLDNPRAAALLNNLDLIVYNRRDNSVLARSASPRNNVEVAFSANAADYVVKVESNETQFPGAQGDEPFALALSASGFSEAQGPNPQMQCAAPANVPSGATFTLSCTATNRGDLDLFRLAATPQLPAGYTGGTQQTFSALAPGQSQTLTWSIRAGTSSGAVRVTASGSAFEEAYPVTSNSLNVAVAAGGGGVSLSLSQTSLAFSQQTGAALAAGQLVNVTSSSGSPSVAASVSTSSGGAWLTATLSLGTAPSVLTIRPTASAASLATGSYNGTVTLTSAGAVNSPLVIAVRLDVTPQASSGLTIASGRLARTVELVNGCPLPTAVTQFNSSDPTAFFWFIARGVRTGDSPVIEWIRSDSVYQRSSLWNPTSAGNFCYAPSLDISRIPVEQRTGQWRARLLWNGQQVANMTFSIVSPPGVEVAVLTGTDEDPGNCDLPVRTTYRTTDELVKACFVLNGVSEGDRFSVRYIRPDGTQHGRFDPQPVRAGLPRVYLWTFYRIKGFPIAGFTGDWTVELQWNGIAIRTMTFRLNPPVTVETARVTNANPNSLGCADPGASRYFLPRDPTATMWFSVADALAGDNLSAEFIAPDGSVYDRVEWDPIESDGRWCMWTWIDINGSAPARMFGNWKVKVTWNGAAVVNQAFQILPVDITGFMVTRATVANSLCSTPVANSNFLNTDAQARLWFTIDLANRVRDVPVVEWLNPSGVVAARSTFNALTDGGGWCLASTLTIAGQNRPVGDWVVRALWNGTEVGRTGLRIDRPAGTQPSSILSHANAAVEAGDPVGTESGEATSRVIGAANSYTVSSERVFEPRGRGRRTGTAKSGGPNGESNRRIPVPGPGAAPSGSALRPFNPQ